MRPKNGPDTALVHSSGPPVATIRLSFRPRADKAAAQLLPEPRELMPSDGRVSPVGTTFGRPRQGDRKLGLDPASQDPRKFEDAAKRANEPPGAPVKVPRPEPIERPTPLPRWSHEPNAAWQEDEASRGAAPESF